MTVSNPKIHKCCHTQIMHIQVHRETHELDGEKPEQHDYDVTDGKHIYRITVSRTNGKPPKIRKIRGNVAVRGYGQKELKRNLNKVFGGRGKFLLFGPRKPVKMDLEDAKGNLRQAFSAQSKLGTWPNPVSAGHSGYVFQGDIFRKFEFSGIFKMANSLMRKLMSPEIWTEKL